MRSFREVIPMAKFPRYMEVQDVKANPLIVRIKWWGIPIMIVGLMIQDWKQYISLIMNREITMIDDNSCDCYPPTKYKVKK